MQFLVLCLCFLLIVPFYLLLLSHTGRISLPDRIALILSFVAIPACFVLGVLQLLGVLPCVNIPID